MIVVDLPETGDKKQKIVDENNVPKNKQSSDNINDRIVHELKEVDENECIERYSPVLIEYVHHFIVLICLTRTPALAKTRRNPPVKVEMTSDAKCLALIFLFPVLISLTLCDDSSHLGLSEDSDEAIDSSEYKDNPQKRDWRKFATWGKRKWSGLSTWGKRNWAGLSTWGKRDFDKQDDLDKRWSNFATWGKRWSPSSALNTWGKRTMDTDDSDMDKRKWSQFATWGKRSPSKWASFSTWGKRDGDEDNVDKRKWSSFSTWGKRGKWMGLSTWGKRSDLMNNEVPVKVMKLFDHDGNNQMDEVELMAFLSWLASAPE
ncbi:hypothetical protein ScPMuIL_016139 [Solemya velum]